MVRCSNQERQKIRTTRRIGLERKDHEESDDWIPDCLVEVEEEVHVEEAGNDDVTMASDDVSPDVNGGDKDLNFLEGANLVENEQPSFPEIYKDGNVPNIQETFSNHLLEGSNDRDILKKRGKGYRKKSRKNNSFSPLGQERPKKKPREGDDFFDLDRFIFVDNRSPISGNTVVETESAQESFHTPDLNKVALHMDDTSGFKVIDGIEANSQDVRDCQANEVNETVQLGKMLGASNINQFEGSVAKMVREEGSQSVCQ
ncbi:hypothetical protein L1987_60474 [Smallanthus sonchifolius]|uniref:Uncharacterized protein n=1 Tax=Smallanthus sonchifolius TaxID=185202 RepID=A0ACB9D827_9ASTR|nr:hypothetical protein L1987_60474 [Smallanthus sonchifolius]